MTRRPLVAVSLKAYLGAADTERWLTEVAEVATSAATTPAGDVELAVLPSFPLLPAAARLLARTSARWGAQDVAPGAQGAQTGEVTAALLAELGCRLAVVGHAERRSAFHEDGDVVRAKVARLVEAGVTPLLCVGEEEQTSPTEAAAVAADQLEDALRGSGAPDVVVGYEPVWAIGAPRPAPAAHVVTVARALRERLDALGVEGRVLYGGAAGPGTLTALAGAVDGVFLGRFAHDVAALRDVLDEAAAARPADSAVRP
ncbi:triose-phosphate isomerase family protein [Krasilnikoviella flava]|uniref:Triosephosphate isomerase n=1 Tax=Krasilnikoviella flava TaxID=526729 RepID=A0A1T5J315_9MICO|nr:triose-phosphate isomerase family protein [Krasilnikoviella flava]SKC45754.1 triosephosphate isomerase [Krasilnikoviella flava]